MKYTSKALIKIALFQIFSIESRDSKQLGVLHNVKRGYRLGYLVHQPSLDAVHGASTWDWIWSCLHIILSGRAEVLDRVQVELSSRLGNCGLHPQPNIWLDPHCKYHMFFSYWGPPRRCPSQRRGRFVRSVQRLTCGPTRRGQSDGASRSWGWDVDGRDWIRHPTGQINLKKKTEIPIRFLPSWRQPLALRPNLAIFVPTAAHSQKHWRDPNKLPSSLFTFFVPLRGTDSTARPFFRGTNYDICF